MNDPAADPASTVATMTLTPEPGADSKQPDPPREAVASELLRDGNYLRYLAGGFLTQLGAQVQSIAVAWQVYDKTQSTLALGLVGLFQVAPVLLLAIPFGHLSDSLDRKRLYLTANAVLMTAATGLAAASALGWSVNAIYGFLILTGIGQALSRPTRWAIQPSLVSRRMLLAAVTWNSSLSQTALISGPALGGLILAITHSATDCYVANAIGLVVVFGLNSTLRLRPTEREEGPTTFASALAGLRFVLRTELLLATMTLDLVAVLLGGATALLPIFARDVLQAGPSGLGWLRAAPAVGSLLMALLMTRKRTWNRTGPVVLGAVAGFGVATIVFGLSQHFWLSFSALLLAGAFDNVSVVVRQTLTQMLTPDSMRGRVSAVNLIFVSSSNELGEFESGVVARFAGATGAVILGGIGAVATAAVVAAFQPALRRLGRLDELQPADPGVAH